MSGAAVGQLSHNSEDGYSQPDPEGFARSGTQPYVTLPDRRGRRGPRKNTKGSMDTDTLGLVRKNYRGNKNMGGSCGDPFGPGYQSVQTKC
ncbi:hypothetical protein BaRGS_00005782 [Batillaria attramentaria]|uniref:Uncharacterized protein n=1 Tax=Batillaria attramentaria TaxID=370345 RepID=A0ABD0LUF6_9CAEN